MTAKQTTNQSGPFKLVKVLSWSSFILILGFSLFLSLFLSNYSEQTMITKQKEFALLLAENLNHQIYRRFMLPTLVGYGSINLSNAEQSARLDQVVRSTLHSFKVSSVRIYDFNYRVSYCTDPDIIGKDDLADDLVKKTFEEAKYRFKLINKTPPFWAFFQYNLLPGTVLLRTIYPLRAEHTPGTSIKGNPIIGILEITQDITDEYKNVLNLDRLIIISSVLTALAIFLTMYMIIRRADRVNTERLKEQEKLERELLEQEKLAGMGRMVASVAHEIRNPLGIIQSSSQLLLGKAQAANMPNAKLLKAIYDESRRLGRTVNDFLDYARPQKPRMAKVDVVKIIDQAILFMERPLAEMDITVEKNFRCDATVCGDKDLLYRAFYNIIANAVQAMNGPGRLSISAEEEGGKLVLVFDDTGPGFDLEKLGRLLDPFYTTKDTGTGLGLAIVGSIFESHDASMELMNNPAGGARIKAMFPKQDKC